MKTDLSLINPAFDQLIEGIMERKLGKWADEMEKRDKGQAGSMPARYYQ